MYNHFFGGDNRGVPEIVLNLVFCAPDFNDDFVKGDFLFHFHVVDLLFLDYTNKKDPALLQGQSKKSKLNKINGVFKE